MEVKLHFRSDQHRHSFDLTDFSTEALDRIKQQKTLEFLALINEPMDDTPIPPAYQLPVMRGKFRK